MSGELSSGSEMKFSGVLPGGGGSESVKLTLNCLVITRPV